MTPFIEPNYRSLFDPRNQKSLSDGLPKRFESFSRLRLRAFGAARQLSSQFWLRFLPTQTQQKPRSQAPKDYRCQFSIAPPSRNRLSVGVFSQSAQSPQEPEGQRHHLDPDLNASFGVDAVESSGSQAQFSFQKSDVMFRPQIFFRRSTELPAARAPQAALGQARRSTRVAVYNGACRRPGIQSHDRAGVFESATFAF